MGDHPRVDVLGVGISALNLESAAAEVASWVDEGERHYVCVTGVHGVMESQRDPELLRIHNGSGLTVPDGMPMVWACNWAGRKASRVYGPDLMRLLSRIGAQRGWRFFLYGADPETLETLTGTLQADYAGVKIVGAIAPPYRDLTEAEGEDYVATINQAHPDIVWVGLSTPKQERWMAEYRPQLDAAALIGVGAAFNIVSGRLPQAPPSLQRLGLEWAYRLAREPRRLLKRYARNNPAFAMSIIRRWPKPVPPGSTNEYSSDSSPTEPSDK